MTNTVLVVEGTYDKVYLESLRTAIQSHAGKALRLDMGAVRKPSTLMMQLLMVTQAEWERHAAPFSLSGVSENVRDAFKSAGAVKLVTCIAEA